MKNQVDATQSYGTGDNFSANCSISMTILISGKSLTIKRQRNDSVDVGQGRGLVTNHRKKYFHCVVAQGDFEYLRQFYLSLKYENYTTDII